MVAANLHLPNIRRFIVPDSGFLIVSMDLAGADAQVVAWEADDADLKAAFRAGLKIHIKNARDMFPTETANMTDADLKKTDLPGGLYYQNKRGVHATNYGGSPHGLAPRLKWPRARVEEFQHRWFKHHPGILTWHKRTRRHLLGTECWRCHHHDSIPSSRCLKCEAALGRTIRNAFGYRRIYFERTYGTGPSKMNDDMWRQALAWVPQSTVGHVVTRGIIRLEEEFAAADVRMLLQVHDEIVYQLPKAHEALLPRIKERLDAIEVPYPDPLYIPWGLKVSDKSWGDCE